MLGNSGGMRFTICIQNCQVNLMYALRSTSDGFRRVTESLSSPYGLRGLISSKPASNFDSETSAILLNGVFRIFRAAGIKIFLVQNVEYARCNVQMFSDCVSQQREVEDLITAQGILQECQASPQELPLDSRKQPFVHERDNQVQLRHRARRVIQRRVPGVVVMRVHVIETGFALQPVGRASSERNIHSRGLCAAVILILKVSVSGIRGERDEIVDSVAIHTAGELKILSQSLFHSSF